MNRYIFAFGGRRFSFDAVSAELAAKDAARALAIAFPRARVEARHIVETIALKAPDDKIAAYVEHECERSGHSEEACNLACPWCNAKTGSSGSCDETLCPNYDNNALEIDISRVGEELEARGIPARMEGDGVASYLAIGAETDGHFEALLGPVYYSFGRPVGSRDLIWSEEDHGQRNRLTPFSTEPFKWAEAIGLWMTRRNVPFAVTPVRRMGLKCDSCPDPARHQIFETLTCSGPCLGKAIAGIVKQTPDEVEPHAE